MSKRPFTRALEEHFGAAIPEADYLSSTADALAVLGFTADNTLACVAVCRDEITAPLIRQVEANWGPPFNLVSLAGMLTAGRTGLSAALHHAPNDGGRRRMVFYAMPHIAISADGTVGEVDRPGLDTPSLACGALHALQQRLAQGSTDNPAFDRLDPEQSLLTTRLTPEIGPGSSPDLVQLCRLAAQAIEDDLWELFRDVAADQPVDGALFTGIQIHGPGGRNHVWPRSGYTLTDGNVWLVDHRRSAGTATDHGRRPRRWLARGAAATTAAVLLNARQKQPR